MARRNFYEVLKDAKFDTYYEYERLWELFYSTEIYFVNRYRKTSLTLKEACDYFFQNLPQGIRKNCISLDDFDNFHEFDFCNTRHNHDFDYYVSFAEYVYNLTANLKNIVQLNVENLKKDYCEYIMDHIEFSIDQCGYKKYIIDNIVIFVAKDPAMISVAEIFPSDKAVQIVMYNHHSLKGDITRKRAVLLEIAKEFEGVYKQIEQINSKQAKEVNFLLNNLNIRHNNIEKFNNYYNEIVASMCNDELEEWYDETYQALLLSFLIIDNIARSQKIELLKAKIKTVE